MSSTTAISPQPNPPSSISTSSDSNVRADPTRWWSCQASVTATPAVRAQPALYWFRWVPASVAAVARSPGEDRSISAHRAGNVGYRTVRLAAAAMPADEEQPRAIGVGVEPGGGKVGAAQRLRPASWGHAHNSGRPGMAQASTLAARSVSPAQPNPPAHDRAHTRAAYAKWLHAHANGTPTPAAHT